MPKKCLNIITECFLDTEIAKMLFYCDLINHQHGASNVANVMRKKFKDIPCLGIIDDDKRKDPYFQDFQTFTEDELFAFKVKNRHFLLVLKPAAEKFLLKIAHKNNLMFDFLTQDFSIFKKQTKESLLPQKMKNEVKKIRQTPEIQEIISIVGKFFYP